MSTPAQLIHNAMTQIGSLADQMAAAATAKQVNTLVQLEAQMFEQEHVIKEQVAHLHKASQAALAYIAKMQDFIGACTSLEPRNIKAKRSPFDAAQKKLSAVLKKL